MAQTAGSLKAVLEAPVELNKEIEVALEDLALFEMVDVAHCLTM